jgi:hypothetical protein
MERRPIRRSIPGDPCRDGGAGSYFPQAIADGARLDDALGAGAWLLARDTVAEATASVRRTG